MPSPLGRYGTRALTSELKKLASEVHTITNDGTPVTREQALADMIWKLALGWTEVQRDEEGNAKKVIHPPVAWAMQYLFERIEGKAPQAITEDGGGIKAADRVRELAKDRINGLARVAAGPPSIKKKESNGG
jgi:hypothetical protein